MPAYGPLSPNFVDLACLVGLFGVYLAAVLRGMEDYSLVARRRPAARARARVRERVRKNDGHRQVRAARSALIVKIGVLAVGRCRRRTSPHGVLRPMAQAEEQRKYGDIKPEALMSLRADEKQRLTSGAMPIDKAMQSLGEGPHGRGARHRAGGLEKATSRRCRAGCKMPGEVPRPRWRRPSRCSGARSAPPRPPRRRRRAGTSRGIRTTTPEPPVKHPHRRADHASPQPPWPRACWSAPATRARRLRNSGRSSRGATSRSPNATPPALQGVDIVEHLRGALPRDARFRDTEGKAVTLGDFFDGKRPTLFVFAYHTCPMLCSLVLDATVKSLNDVHVDRGRRVRRRLGEHRPEGHARSGDEEARAGGRTATRAPTGSTKGWHFLTGEESQIRKVTDAIGFKYQLRPAPEAVRAPRGDLPAHARGAHRAATSTGSRTTRATCASGCSRRPRGARSRRPSGSSCTATTTTRRGSNTRWSR